MRTLKFLLEKEFRQIFRNKSLLPILFVLPMVQLLTMPLAADFDIKDIRVAIVDNDHSSYSRRLTEKIGASGYFHIEGFAASYAEALRLVGTGSADIILEIPPQFARNLVKEGDQKVYLAADAINGMKGSLGASYLTAVLTDFNNDIRVEWMQPQKMEPQPTIEIVQENWFNPSMNYPFFMVPGILVILVTMVAGFIAALNIVQEKEIGTIEQINVTPIKKWQFILGKLIPFWLIGMIDFTIGLLIARLVYGIVPVGHIGTLYLFLSVYLVALLGFGLLVSTYSDNQLQAMFVAFFFIMIFILMSGLFTPVENMPGWAKVISHMTPVTYFIEVMRMIVLKGSDFGDIRTPFLIVLGFAVLLNAWAIFNYRKTS
ncbi:MAG: ABC transporter permease [Bacteroidota bacterium]|nr:ABC transporter permease [Bacteroidota bacterium]